jgi:tetratricopeptide (TPR) repeat protein
MDSPSTIHELSELLERSQYLTAYSLGLRAFGDLRSWPGAAGRALAIRLANHLGGHGWVVFLLREGMKLYPNDSTLTYYWWHERCASRRMIRRWLELRDLELPGEPTADLQAHWLMLKGSILAAIRDFERAFELSARALALVPSDPWVLFEQGYILEQAEERDRACEYYRKSLSIRPNYRPAVLALTNRLHQNYQDEEALTILRSADEVCESGAIRWQLSLFLEECGHYEDAWKCLDGFERYFPLARRHKHRDWLEVVARRRCDLASLRGDDDEALRWAKECQGPFFATVTKNLETRSPTAQRRRLKVPFVQQDHLTCAPASLAMLCDYFGFPTTHDEIASRICYDGTRAADERRWAEGAGLTVREFCVTVPAAQRLIDAGFPFALQTVEPQSAHLQVIAGYDAKRGTLLIQDPGSRMLREGLAEELLKRYQPTGPAGLVIAPPGKATELNGIELPDAALYDRLHRLQAYLRDHQRDAAVAELEQLRLEGPKQRVTLIAETLVAGYDGSPLAQLAATEALLAEFPDDEALALSRLRVLKLLERSDSIREQLEQWLKSGKGSLATWVNYAEVLESAADASLRDYWLWRIVSYQPTHADALQMLAMRHWDRGLREDSHELLRLAACAEHKREHFSSMFFNVSRRLGKTEEGLRFLRLRFENYGQQSGLPGLTLARAYDVLDEAREARRVLDQSLKLRPEDGELILGIVELLPNLGGIEDAEKLLAEHRQHCRPVDWLISHARLLEMRGNSQEALQIWRKLADEDPLYVIAHGEVARLLADTQNVDAALDYVRQASDRYPNSRGLATLAITWIRGEHLLEEAERRLDAMLQAHPDDAWAYRDRAIVRANSNRQTEALADAREAVSREPDAQSYQILGFVQAAFGDRPAAVESYQQSLIHSIDSESAQDLWLRECTTQAEIVAALDWILARIKSERTSGQGLLNWYLWARRNYHPDRIWELVEEAHQARQDLWQTWSIRLQQLSAMKRHAEALEFAKKYVDRFPVLAISWSDQGDAANAAGNRELEIESLLESVRLAPQWIRPVIQLAIAQQADKQDEAAEKTLRKALAGDPRSTPLRLQLAKLLDRGKEALEQLSLGARFSPGDDEVWGRLTHASEDFDQGATARRVARELTEQRPEDSRSWLRLAEMLQRPEHRTEAYQALQRCLKLRPRSLDAYDLWARYLCEDGKLDEAMEKCQPSIFDGAPQPQLLWRLGMVYEAAGNDQKGLETYQKVLQLNPGMFQGWVRVADLAERLKSDKDYDEAAEQLVAIDPHSPIGYGYRSTTRLRANQRPAAIADLEKAISLDPKYLYAASELVRLYLEDSQRELAEQVVQRVGPWIEVSQRVELEQRLSFGTTLNGCSDAELAAKVEQLTEFGEKHPDAIGRIANQVHPSQAKFLEDWCWKELAKGTSKGVVGKLAVALAVRQENYRTHSLTKKLKRLRDSPGWEGSLEMLVLELAERRQGPQILEVAKALRKRIVKYPAIASSMAYELLRANLNAEVIEWCRYWEKDSSRPATDFLPRIIAQWNIGSRLALKSVEVARQRTGGDQSAVLQIWIAVAELYRGDVPKLREILARINVQQLEGWYSEVYRLLAVTGVGIESGDPETMRSVIAGELTRYFKSHPDSPSRKIAFRCRSLLYQRLKCRWKSWWDYWHSVNV